MGPSGGQAGGSSTAGSQAAGASASGAQAAGASSKGGSVGGSGAQGAQQAGMVSQGEIDFYAKVADVQSKVQTSVEVRDARQGKSGGGAGGGGDKASADAELQRIRQDLSKEIQAGKAEEMRDGAKIIIRLAEQGSFKSGSADLQPEFMQLLSQVGKTVGASKGRVFIEGHTDNVPVVYNERFRSNWDLSGARAGAVADYMSTSAGLAAGRMSVSGFADTKPLESNGSAQGRSRNRRIEIIVDGA